ncbi:family 1 glycosylhydrolase [Sphingobium sp. WCS2017Hpa-17]|uniref:family 1 glycosylhydrolase n=1 Tax=Sphingobium sp. WCS2017Hpa-17 TaxID=3073638 RepID=UPI00288A7DEB|nr:family 1 glycosylhydrolase [Sphingobium sp. WCS2017Hpa-17]
MDDGVPVQGYLHWSPIANFEWVFGYGPKFGLHNLDRTAILGAIARPTQSKSIEPAKRPGASSEAPGLFHSVGACAHPFFSGGSVTFTSSPLWPGKLVNITSIRFGTR